jgi:hypothetical protein
VTKRRRIVVVDGSNLATEGRSSPSLKQLDEAVRAFASERPDDELVVIVDATFEHRVAPGEREKVKQAELAGEIVTPPAGAIGRGDGFILKIAKRADAVVLSNDSFQEFHAEHPWLFEEGRLVGGKPVPRVGWVFTPRIPVRGSKSRAVTKKAAATKKAAPQARPAKKAVAEAPAPRPAAKARARAARSATKAAEAPAKLPAKLPAKQPAKRARAVAAATPVKAPAATAKTSARTSSAKRAPAKRESARAARPAAAAKATPSTNRVEPVNTARSFQRLVKDHAVGSKLDGEVVQFTSHGALVSVGVGRTMRVLCYAPLAGLGSPAPTRARDVLKKGDVYPFTIVSFDETRRRAELALVS